RRATEPPSRSSVPPSSAPLRISRRTPASTRMTDHALPQLFDLGNHSFGNVDRETNLVSGLQPLEERRRIDAIAHRHRFQEILDLSVPQDDLARPRHRRDDLSFADDSL